LTSLLIFVEFAVSSAALPRPLASNVAILNQTGTSFNIRCGICTKPMQRTLPQSAPPATSATNTAVATATHARSSLQQQQLGGVLPVWACPRHPSSEAALSTCAICHLTVRGLFLWCVGCSHGGHLSHMQEPETPELPLMAVGTPNAGLRLPTKSGSNLRK
uniref:UBP-type domain-containing protein n=1 Tax=Schistocephalus solidus TaxID=70667 RepID=A0A183TBC5_SCHSO